MLRERADSEASRGVIVPRQAGLAAGDGRGLARHHPMSGSFAPSELADALVEVVPAAAARRDEIRVVRAPGRVNLIGEHTDDNEGFVLPAAIDLEPRIACLPTTDRHVGLTRLDTGDRYGFDLDRTRATNGSWLDYVAGTARAMLKDGAAEVDRLELGARGSPRPRSHQRE